MWQFRFSTQNNYPELKEGQPLAVSGVQRGRLPRLAIFLPNFILGLTSASEHARGRKCRQAGEEKEKHRETPGLVLLL